MGVVERMVLLISIFTHQYVVSLCPDRLLVEWVVVVEYDCERWIWTASPAGLVVE
jgi:hypothetical protein